MKSNTCIKNLIRLIVLLQNNSLDIIHNASDCSKPFLGPSISTAYYNTRVVNLYNSYGNLISGTYEKNNTFYSTTFFRIQNISDDYCTLLLLNLSDNTYLSTEQTIMININMIKAIKCINDVSINL